RQRSISTRLRASVAGGFVFGVGCRGHTLEAPMTDASHPTLGTAIHALRRNWAWFVGLGVLSIIAGLLALGNLMLGTLVSILFIGAMMTVAGIAHIIHAFQVREWGQFALWLLIGILY